MSEEDSGTAAEKTIEAAKKFFAEVSDEEAEQRERMRDDLKFSAGEQWPLDLKNKRENNPRGAQPCLTMDKTNQFARQVVNDARQNKPGIKVRPVDDIADPKVAEILQGLCRHIEDVSSASDAYDRAIDSAVKAGIGWIRVTTVVIDDATNEQEIRIDPVSNIFSVYSDTDWKRPDGRDMTECLVTEEIPRKKFEAAYPDADPVSWEDHQTDPQWATKETVRVAEYFRVVDREEIIVILSDGSEVTQAVFEKEYPGEMILGTKTKKCRYVKWSKMTAVEVLEETEIPCQWIGMVPVIGNEHWVDGKRQLTGQTYWAKDAARAYNYARSAGVEQISLAPKAPFIAAAGQVEEYQSEWRTANTENHAVLRYDPMDVNGTPVPPPQRQMPPQASSGWMQEMQIAEHDIESALGMYAASLGRRGNATSGKQELAQQREGDTSTFHYIDNLSKAVCHIGRILIDMIPRIYDTQRVIRILGENGDQKKVTLDPKLSRPLVEYRDQTGAIRRMFNPKVGKYDATVTVGPSYNTKRMESSEAMINAAQTTPQLWGTHGDLIVESQDWPNADRFADRFRKMLPPNLRDEEEDGQPQIPPQVQQQMAMMQQQMQQMQQMLQQAQQELAQNAAEAQARQMELQIKGQEVQVKQFDAETKRIQATAPEPPPPQDGGEIQYAIEAMKAKTTQETELAKTQMQIEGQKEIALINARAKSSMEHGMGGEESESEESGGGQMMQMMQEMCAAMKAAQTVSLRQIRGQNGKLSGVIQVKADGSEIQVPIQ